MAEHYQVLTFLRPQGGYTANGQTFESINFVDCEPFTKEEYEAAFAQYDAWEAEQDAAKAAVKAELLQRLGITADEARLLLS